VAENESPQYFRRSQAVIPKGNEVGEIVTIDNPAMTEFPKFAKRLLIEVCKLNNIPAEVPRGFFAKMVESERTLLLKPTNEENPDAFEARRAGQQVWTNLYELLAFHNMIMPKGVRQQVPVKIRTKGDLAPCLELLFDQAKTEPVDSRTEVAASQDE